MHNNCTTDSFQLLNKVHTLMSKAVCLFICLFYVFIVCLGKERRGTDELVSLYQHITCKGNNLPTSCYLTDLFPYSLQSVFQTFSRCWVVICFCGGNWIIYMQRQYVNLSLFGHFVLVQVFEPLYSGQF